ncbi:MAG: hypothetical protein EZS28_004148 [Streblomastix strix]|uniref:Uncharacterized protein n=1 Tax=Streblomastix strix TaxID=222440 RepID=A0A5J4WZH4_9EUKA|nr:MAG: hypothetical protein EZS28_004148 [Streblomastix strix]
MRKTAQVKKHSFLSASSSDETQEEEIISDQRQQNQNQNKNQRPNSSQVYKSQFPGLEGIEPEIENGIGNPLLDLSRKQSGSNINKRIDEEEEEGFGDSDEDNAEVLRDAYIRQKKYQNELLQYNTDQQQTLIKADEKGGYTLIALLGVGTDTQMSAISSLGFLQKLNNLSFKGNQQLPIEILTDSNVAFQNKLYPASIIRLLPNIQINQNVSSSEAIEKIKQLQNEGKRVIVASAGLGEMDEIKVLESGDVGICVGNKGTSSWFHILKKHQQMEQMKEQHDDEPRSEYKSEFKDESKEMININMLTSSLKSMRKATKSIADSGISRVALSIQMSRNIICSINRAISLCFANMIGFVLITLLETILGIRILNIRPIFGVLLFIITQLIGSAAIVVGTVSGALWDLERAVNKDEPPRSDQIKQELDEIKYAQRNRKRQIEKNKLLSDEKIRETQNDQNNKPFVYQLSLSFWRRTILLALAEVILVIFLLFLWGNDAQMLDNEDRRERCSLLWIQSLNMKVNNNIYHYDIQNISNAIYLQDAVEASPLLFPDSICKQHSILSGSNDNSVAIFSQRHIAVVAQFIIYSHILGILAIAFASFGDTSIGFKNFSYKMRQFIKRKNREHKEKKIKKKKNKMKQDSYDMYTEQDEDYSNFFTKSITRDMTRNWRNRNMSISNFSAILIFVLCAFILAYVIIMLSSAQRQFFFPGLKQSYALSLSFASLVFSFIYFFFQACFW